MATTSPPSDEAHKVRILTHMNHEHIRELSHYLRAFLSIPASAARTAQLTDVSLASLTITTTISGTTNTYTYPLDPPLKSLAEMRPRLIALDTEARGILGLSDIYINEYRVPKGFDAVVGFLVATYFLQWIFLEQTTAATESLFHQMWAGWFPGGMEWYVWTVKAIFWPVLACHVIEAAWFEKSRLRVHSVERGSRVWWTWLVSIFFEGFPAFQRWDGMVEEKKRAKEAKQH